MRFKYLGFILQNGEEIRRDANHQSQVEWLKWRTSGVLCDTKVPLKLKENFYQTLVTPTMLYVAEC
jgi:hypothetical protein